MANSFSTSKGERIPKKQIDINVRAAKGIKLADMYSEHGYIFCEEEGCGKNASAGEPIDCSHDISVKECQESGRSELAWDVDNITMRCRTCHAKRDGLNIQSGK